MIIITFSLIVNGRQGKKPLTDAWSTNNVLLLGTRLHLVLKVFGSTKLRLKGSGIKMVSSSQLRRI